MMGRSESGQEKLFYQFCLEEAVPPDHLVGRIDHFLDLSWPEPMIRMLIIGYVFAIGT